MITAKILEMLEAESPFFHSPIHGIEHWQRVEQFALHLAHYHHADPDVASLFAYFHDCMRHNEGDDPEHGARGASFAEKNKTLLGLSDSQLQLLLRACRGHTHGARPNNPTINICWDADRLDLGRVGISPQPRFFYSKESIRIIENNLFNEVSSRKNVT